MPYRHPAEPCRPHQLLHALSVLSLCLTVWLLASPALAQDALLEWFPSRPVNFDAVLRQQTFGPNDREITVQADITALRYGDIEVRGLYRYFSRTAMNPPGSRQISMRSYSTPATFP